MLLLRVPYVQVLFITTDDVAFEFVDEIAPGQAAMFPAEGSVSHLAGPSMNSFSTLPLPILDETLDLDNSLLPVEPMSPTLVNGAQYI